MLGLRHRVSHHTIEQNLEIFISDYDSYDILSDTHRHDLRHGGAGGGVTGVTGLGHLDGVDPELVGQVLQLCVLVLGRHHPDSDR